MEPETSQFESSEMLATYLASTPLVAESWRLCSRANAAAQQSFGVNRVGGVTYVAFSAVQAVDCTEESCRSLVELDGGAKGVFGTFSPRWDDHQEPVMVHGGLLQLFLLFYHSHNFQEKMLEIMNTSKSVVFTGHSLGGAIASLSALWLLSNIETSSPSVDVFCITYGSPMLGNKSFCQAILQKRWSGNFCHVVGPHDLVPRLLFAPATPIMEELKALFGFWHLSMSGSQYSHEPTPRDKMVIFNVVLGCVEERSRGVEDGGRSLFWPFGSYMFCTENGAICMDNRVAIVKLLHLMMAKGSPELCVEDHLKYGDYVAVVGSQYLQMKRLTDVCSSESSNEAGIALALQSCGLVSQEPFYGTAKNCLAMARHLGCRQNLNNAKMAVSLAKINPRRAEIEWYKTYCDNSDDQLGYYDSFKRQTASRQITRVNINRIRLGQFWDELIRMIELNQVTHDFHKLLKYVNASHYYMLLVEPLEIAEYYKTCMHKKKGHYIEHGRERRFKIFDKWWRERKVGNEESNPRTRFANLTQDSCFWARVEEARDCIYRMTGKMEAGRSHVLLEKIKKFEAYAEGMIERKAVSVDVLAKNSSYNLFVEEWKELKSQLRILAPRFPVLQDGMAQDMVVEGENTFFHDGKLVS